MDRYSVCLNEMNQGEAISVFTLMILEIAIQKIKISPTSKTCNMSDRPSLAQTKFICLIAVSVPSKYSALSTTIEIPFKL